MLKALFSIAFGLTFGAVLLFVGLLASSAFAAPPGSKVHKCTSAVTSAKFQEVIDAWPSPRAFADDMGTKDSHVRTMRARDSIPSGLWTTVVERAAVRGIEGVTLELLAGFAEAKRDVA